MRAVNAHAVQHKHDAIEYQNHLVVRVEEMAEMMAGAAPALRLAWCAAKVAPKDDFRG